MTPKTHSTSESKTPSRGRRSAIYRGRVAHGRHAPRPHHFSYSLFQLYLDLDELPELFDSPWLWSHERLNVASFRRRHYLGDPEVPLKDAVRARVAEATGESPPNGPVGLLTNLAYLGYCFNPVSFYYLFGPDGETLHSIVAEITNTPWKERHQYVLVASEAERSGEWYEWRFDKDFHVSPFFEMNHRYRWRFTSPHGTFGPGTTGQQPTSGAELLVAMENRIQTDGGPRVFDASLRLSREELTQKGLRRCLIGHPWMTGKVHGAIYWQALRLWLKKAPFISHPKGA